MTNRAKNQLACDPEKIEMGNKNEWLYEWMDVFFKRIFLEKKCSRMLLNNLALNTNAFGFQQYWKQKP